VGELRFNDNGTLSISINDETYTLKRPTTSQLFDFWDMADDLRISAQEELISMRDKLTDLKADEASEKLVEDLRKRRRHAYEFTTIPFLREAFTQFGNKELPKDLTDAPAEIMDPSLVTQLLDFWRTVPLAHSARRK